MMTKATYAEITSRYDGIAKFSVLPTGRGDPSTEQRKRGDGDHHGEKYHPKHSTPGYLEEMIEMDCKDSSIQFTK